MNNENKEEKKWPFVSSVLLKNRSFNPKKLSRDLRHDWGIDVSEAMAKDPEALVFDQDGILCTISYMPAKVPREEAEERAVYNYMWPEAVNVAKQHQAHILIALLGRQADPRDMGKLMVKLAASCLKQVNATGIYTIGTVMNPDVYIRSAEFAFRENKFPVMNLIYFELFSNDRGRTASVDTYGMSAFGKHEMEVVDSSRQPQDLLGFMTELAALVMDQDIDFPDGGKLNLPHDQSIDVHLVHDEHLDIDILKFDY